MNVGGVSPNYPVTYNAEKAQKTGIHKSFAKSMSEVVQESGVGAIGSVNESGDIVMDSLCDSVNDLLTVVYKTPDFDPENPAYKVKTWDTEGNVTERMIDVSKINTKNCDSFELLAYLVIFEDTYICVITSEKLYQAMMLLKEGERAVIILDFWYGWTDQQMRRMWSASPSRSVRQRTCRSCLRRRWSWGGGKRWYSRGWWCRRAIRGGCSICSLYV